ncbi:MAG: hypothetical protein IJX70_05725 [Clostridia bacterium]|nr:hypothetical protein [Clostridia bacterium]
MTHSLVVFNENSGRAKSVQIDQLIARFLSDPNPTVIGVEQLSCFLPAAFTEVLVAGGDGTLRAVLQWAKEVPLLLKYYPCGTLNERAHTPTRLSADPVVGELSNGEIFTYVLATGSFTPIGYTSTVAAKQKQGAWAYVRRVLSAYRAYDFPLSVEADEKHIEGNYTLAMLIKSRVCFRFPFNRLYDPTKESAHLLLVRSFGKDGLIARARLFFPFFRIFFLGIRRPIHTGRILFQEVSTLTLTSPQNLDWCMDGEKRTLSSFSLSFRCVAPTLQILPID